MLPLPKPDWKEVQAWLQTHFPDVHHVSVDELAAWQACNLPLACATGFTIKVHPFDDHWGVLLDPWHHTTRPNESQ